MRTLLSMDLQKEDGNYTLFVRSINPDDLTLNNILQAQSFKAGESFSSVAWHLRRMADLAERYSR